MKQWYEDLFDNYAETYDREPFTKGTIDEVTFIENEIQSDRSKTILDVGCGTGRHAIELAKRGYSVTGIDLSESQLERARHKAERANVNITFLCRDARNFDLDSSFDLVIMLCEGAFSLMETDEMNFDILNQAASHLNAGGKFIFTTLNALYPLYHSVKDFINNNTSGAESMDNTFDLMTFRDRSTISIVDDFGNQKQLDCDERYYAPSEITWMLKSLGFKRIDIFGCDIGVFNRNKPLTTEDYEMLVIAEKP